ncbi:MAG TPA: hypothetical protein VIF62_03880 [Labilithrix sp.]|jgi:hypothetical protein
MRRLLLVLLLVFVPFACKEKQPAGGVVATSDAAVAVDAGAASSQPDLSKCTGCQLAPSASWSFEGIFADPQCTIPVAQIDVPACAQVPALGQTSLSWVDDFGTHKPSDQGNVNLTTEVAPQSARFRKNGKSCVKANETATSVAPPGCSGQRICRDANGALTCGSCRLLQNGCPDYEESRLYASMDDQAAKPSGGGGGGNLGRLQQCCSALAAQAKALGPSPEAGLIAQAAAQCSALVAQAGPSGSAPELGVIRNLLAGRNVPAICAGF